MFFKRVQGGDFGLYGGEFREDGSILASTAPIYAIFVPKNEKIDYTRHPVKVLATDRTYDPLPAYRVDLVSAGSPHYITGIIRHANRYRRQQPTDRQPAPPVVPTDYRPNKRARAGHQFRRFLHGTPGETQPARPRLAFRPLDWLGFIQLRRPQPWPHLPADAVFRIPPEPKPPKPPRKPKKRGRPRNTDEQNRATAARERELRKARDKRYAAAHREQVREADRKRRAARTGSTAARGAAVWTADSSARGADSGQGLENRENRAGALRDEVDYFDFC